MKTNLSLLTRLLIPVMIVVLSCKDDKDETFSTSDVGNISEEAMVESYYQDVDDMGTVALGTPSDNEYAGGRYQATFSIDDNRFKCDGVVVTLDRTGTLNNPEGTITVNFGTAGCTDLRGNIRKGQLVFAYSGKRFQPGSTVTTTPVNYSINGVKLEGVRTSTNVTGSTDTSPKFHTVLTDGKATFENNEVAYRESDVTWQLVRSQTPGENYLLIDASSTANGTTRNSHEYVLTLSKSLKYKRFCGIAVEGIKNYLIDDSKEISIDYGDGSCDKTVSISINGVSRTVTLN